MDLFVLYLSVFGLLATFIQFQGSTQVEEQHEQTAAFKAFRNNYVFVYSLAMAGDWLQGPYIYALYEHYGYTVKDIGQLFIAGFGSSMLVGTLAGALADKHGRKVASIMYTVLYSLSCATKHSGNFYVLLAGRLLGGVSTSLLFSSFEAWLVAEHVQRGFAESLLGSVFSSASLLGAGLMAILSGLIGNVLVEDLKLGPVAPFDAAVLVLAVAGVVMCFTWPENYGNRAGESVAAGFSAALSTILKDRRVALLGACQALFEASMYTFVFLWTPALSPDGQKVPHGMVFSCFMTACMVGSAASGLLLRMYQPHQYMVWVYLVSALSMAVPFMFHLQHRNQAAGTSLGNANKGGINLQGHCQLLAFCVFEACLGLFWPSMSTMRAQLVPDTMRSTVINIFRIPLNLFVCIVLYKVSLFPLSVYFGLCIVLLLACVKCQLQLNASLQQDDSSTLPKHSLLGH